MGGTICPTDKGAEGIGMVVGVAPRVGDMKLRIAALSDEVRCMMVLSSRMGDGPPRAAAKPRSGLSALDSFIASISLSRNSALAGKGGMFPLTEEERTGMGTRLGVLTGTAGGVAVAEACAGAGAAVLADEGAAPGVGIGVVEEDVMKGCW